ncbi:MAG TPA: D-glycerate dehydrogenase [Actinomycetota bacterium]|nr:D-glycerate dehydrogenase [Actinomycetota bacterium]
MTDRPPVLVTRRLADEVMRFLDDHCMVTLNDEDRPMPRERLLAEVKGKRGLLPMLTDRIDDELLDAAGPDLAVVANFAVGYDNVDVAACTARGVLVTNTPDVLTDATADITWSLILAASRRLGEGERLIRTGRVWAWAPDFMLGREVTGKTLGVVGMGRIGQAVAARARGFRMRILYHSRTRKTEAEAVLEAEHRDLPSLLAESDIVSVHVSLSEETHHLFGAEEFRAMKPTAVFVNTTRGPVVDEGALVAALERGDIFAAGLDVYEREPEVHPNLLSLENVVLVPHLGSATVETRTAMGMLAAENLVSALEGKPPPSLVNPEALESQR